MPRTMASAKRKQFDPSRKLRDEAPKQPKQVDAHVGSKIRDRRRELGLSQTALGNKVGVTFQQVQKYERGVNRVGASRLAAIAKALGVPIAYFFPEDDSKAGIARRIAILERELARLRRLL
jgi:transcriptional regulator with XRE-family HTH domain